MCYFTPLLLPSFFLSLRETVQTVSGRVDPAGTEMFPVQSGQGWLDQQPVPLHGTRGRCGHSEDRGRAGKHKHVLCFCCPIIFYFSLFSKFTLINFITSSSIRLYISVLIFCHITHYTSGNLLLFWVFTCLTWNFIDDIFCACWVVNIWDASEIYFEP